MDTHTLLEQGLSNCVDEEELIDANVVDVHLADSQLQPRVVYSYCMTPLSMMS